MMMMVGEDEDEDRDCGGEGEKSWDVRDCIWGKSTAAAQIHLFCSLSFWQADFRQATVQRPTTMTANDNNNNNNGPRWR